MAVTDPTYGLGMDSEYAGACVNPDNAEAYCKRQLAFVMGTTGGDRVKLVETVNNAGSYAVIAPNMGKQVSVQWIP